MILLTLRCFAADVAGESVGAGVWSGEGCSSFCGTGAAAGLSGKAPEFILEGTGVMVCGGSGDVGAADSKSVGKSRSSPETSAVCVV